MTYQDIVYLIFTIFSTLLALPTIHFFVFGVIGLFVCKKYPKAQKLRKYGVIIPARNEEKVVAHLIESVKKNHYPQELLTIFVVAHNCTDKTAEVARSAGAVVYEYDNLSERTMGYAFKHLFECIGRDYGTQSFDGFLMFNADNILSENYIEKMNDAFEYWGERDTVTSFRNSKNFGQNVISGLYGLHFMSCCRFESRGRTVCGCSTRVQGTGYLINSEVVKNGWKYVTLTEDWEFSADQILTGHKIRYCDEAEFFDEQPTTVKIMLRQRLRWAKGHLLVFGTKAAQLFAGLFRPSVKNKGSVYDILASILPYSIIGVFAGILQFILLSPLFGVPFFDGLPIVEYVVKNWSMWVISTGSAYMLSVLQAVLVLVCERKRILNVSVGKKLLFALLWPLFNLITIPLQVVALFKKVEWKEIPHKAAISHNALNGNVTHGLTSETVATVAQKAEEDKSEKQ